MKIILLVNIDFEYHGHKKMRFMAGDIFEAINSFEFINGIESNIVNGYWIGNERAPRSLNFKGEAPNQLIRTKVFLNECQVIE